MRNREELRERALGGVTHHDSSALIFWGSALLGAVALAGSARMSFALPGAAAPQTLQTFALIAVGLLLGLPRGVLAVLFYLLAGALGAPVFADGASGFSVLAGRTAGYLWGFLPAVALAGVAGRSPRFVPLFGAGVAGHAVVLVCGWAWLARSIGAPPAFEHGVAPFLVGGVVKSAAAALLAWAVVLMLPVSAARH